MSSNLESHSHSPLDRARRAIGHTSAYPSYLLSYAKELRSVTADIDKSAPDAVNLKQEVASERRKVLAELNQIRQKRSRTK